MTTDTNLDIAALDTAHSLHPWTHFESFVRDGPLVIERGSGCSLWDTDGREYLDAVGGLWCTNIGLGRREMGEVIAAQAEKLAFCNTFVDMTNGPAALLSAKLADLAPGDLNHVHLTTGGSTAVDSAYRMVAYYQRCAGRPEKTQVIARDSSYHGSTYATISIGKRAGDKMPEFEYATKGIHHISAPDCYRAIGERSEAEFCDDLVGEFEAKIAEIGPEKIGGFFAEPIQASGGVVVPPKDYLKRIAAVCHKHDILFIADEVVTGFGRLGHWFASWDEFGAQPDIICCAKGLSSGYQPIGAMIFSDRIWDAMQGDRWYASGFTYAGHPVACAASLKNIEIIEREDLLSHATDVGQYFEDRLSVLEGLPLIGDVRGRKLMLCVESVADKTTKTLLPDHLDVGKRIADAAEARGLMVRPMGHLNVMSPPLVITKSQIDFIAETLEASVKEVTDQLVRNGERIG
ncbi:aminotransferase [Litoreibacter janthinus]|uniref:Adenosylmethionine-8-amino-7-oxononanoate aminotransferase n=1 Tax=Litoreibacter janthinus TaxID=670154 RepID=A0A1I6H3W6_9RHOB|nr:aminotransferase [Litoreibacter janthinus]SFR49001.1 Adenosylmethionine-8-amino-7-oxononanoate aminotransferase [Litoreibacter janthinus]